MSDTITVSDALERAAGKLDLVTKEMYAAQTAVEKVEERWEPLLDAVAESLEDEYRDKGRKAAPSENAILVATRRQHRDVYTELKRAKRRVEKAQDASKNRRQQASAYQTMMNNLGAEALVQDYLAQRVEEPVA